MNCAPSVSVSARRRPPRPVLALAALAISAPSAALAIPLTKEELMPVGGPPHGTPAT
jgi:hypothetical protein